MADDTETRKIPPTPATLGAAGAELWRQVVTGYTLRPDELRLLQDACHEADLIDAMQSALTEDLLTEGSKGQTVIAPVVAELRQHRMVLARLLRQLSIPDDDATADRGSMSRTVAARELAARRWSRP